MLAVGDTTKAFFFFPYLTEPNHGSKNWFDPFWPLGTFGLTVPAAMLQSKGMWFTTAIGLTSIVVGFHDIYVSPIFQPNLGDVCL